jgi:predicted 2-oxoglutarate/Fe(II)-dependent dioxygenase YbiX
MPAVLYRQPAFFDTAACLRIRRAMDAGAADDAEILAGAIETRQHVRRASSIDIDPVVIADVESRLDATRAAIAGFFGAPLGGREGAGFLRYRDGDFYAAHRDRAFVASWPDARRRRIALVAFLNASRAGGAGGDFDGGLLRLYPDPAAIDVPAQAGLLVAFPADLLHEVTAVRGGVRDVVVDWFYDE